MSHPRLVAPCVLARGLTLDSSSPSGEGATAAYNTMKHCNLFWDEFASDDFVYGLKLCKL